MHGLRRNAWDLGLRRQEIHSSDPCPVRSWRCCFTIERALQRGQESGQLNERCIPSVSRLRPVRRSSSHGRKARLHECSTAA